MFETERTALYSVHPGIQGVQDWIETLKQKTGRNLDEWIELVQESGPTTEVAQRDWLKAKFGFGTNSASWIAGRANGHGQEDSDPELYLKAAEKYVEAMFEGKRSALRPIYDRVLHKAFALGDDVKACPCKTIVPLYRKSVFAQIKPATNTRIDMGYALGDMPATGRLIDTGGFAKKDRITHRIPITALDEINEEVERWLRTAYDMNA